MENSSKQNISHLEAEIDNKTSMAYLYAIASKANATQASQLFKERYTELTQSTNIKSNKNEQN